MLRLAVCFLAWLACASSASGTVLIEDLATYQKSPASEADDYIEGVIKGIFVASNELEFKGKEGLVCPPQDQFKFEPQLAAKILSEYLEKHAPKADPKEDIAVPMIYALMDKFPCK